MAWVKIHGNYGRHPGAAKQGAGGSQFTYERYGCTWKEWKKVLLGVATEYEVVIRGHRAATISEADVCEQFIVERCARRTKRATPISAIESLRRYMCELPDAQHAALILWKQGYTHAEIGGKLGCSEQASRDLVYRGKNKLRKSTTF